jgi:hypothetical protein
MNTLVNFGARGGNLAIIETDSRKQNQLIRDFDERLELHKQNRLELGRIARELKALHLTHGERERGKGWEAFLADRDLQVRTVDRWIEAYEVANGLRREKTVPDKMSRTNSENKGVSRPETIEPEPIEEDVIDSIPQPKPDVCPTSEPAPPSSRMDSIASKDSSKPEGRSNLPFDTADKRKAFMFQQVIRALQAGNVYTESLRREWDEVDQRVRQWLDSFAVANTVPTYNISQIQQRKQEN